LISCSHCEPCGAGFASFATVPDSVIPNPHGQPHGDPVGDFAGQVATVEYPRAFNCWASVSSAEKCEATTAESSMARFAFINLCCLRRPATRSHGFISCGAGPDFPSLSVTRANAQGKRSKRILRSAAASSLNWPGYGWRRPPMSKRPRVTGLHLLACLVLRRDCGVVFCASSPSIAARIHSRAMSNSLSRSSGLLACLASLTQSRANSSNSDPDDTHLRQGPNFV
jgi:hypothetical protein